MLTKIRQILKRETGSSLPYFALFVVLLVGFAAITLDGSTGYLLRRQMQNAADAAALAGARHLAYGDSTSVIDARIQQLATMNGAESVTWDFTEDGQGVWVQTEASYDTGFASLFGVNTLVARAESEAKIGAVAQTSNMLPLTASCEQRNFGETYILAEVGSASNCNCDLDKDGIKDEEDDDDDNDGKKDFTDDDDDNDGIKDNEDDDDDNDGIKDQDEKKKEDEHDKSHDNENDKSHDNENDKSHDNENDKSHDNEHDKSHDNENDKSHDNENDKSHDNENDKSHDNENDKSHDNENDKSHDNENDKSHDNENDKSHDNENDKSHDGENEDGGSCENNCDLDDIFLWDSEQEAPGNFGWLDWNGGSHGVPELIDDIEDPSRSGEWEIGDWIPGRPGVKNASGVIAAINEWVGKHVTIPLYDEISGNGSNTEYHICGFAEFIITDYDFQGNSKWIKGEFIQFLKEPSEIGPAPDFGLMSVTLTK